MDGEHGKHRFQPARTAQEMAGHRLGRVHDQLFGMIAKRCLDGVGFVGIAQRGGRTMSIHELHLLRIHACIVQGIAHGTAWAVHIGCRHMVGIGTHAVTDEFSIYLRAAFLGSFILFQHHDTGTFANDKAVPVPVPWATCGRRVVIAGR